MSEISVIGIDLAKSVFQCHGAAADGATLFRRRPSRGRLERFMAGQPPRIVAMEACASAHRWARRMTALGHEVRLIAPVYVKPLVKRQKTDAADAEAIVEAAMRPSMPVKAPKSAEAQARAMLLRARLFRAREQVLKQRTETVNALRGHLAELGLVAPAGIGNVPRLAVMIEDEGSELPPARPRDGATAPRARRAPVGRDRPADAEDRRPAASRTMPGAGAIAAMAVETFAPDLASFGRGRDFAARLGLTPREHSSGGKQRLGRTSRMGEPRRPPPADHRRHEPDRRRAAPPRLDTALAPRQARAQAPHGRRHRGAPKLARQIRAMLTRGEAYRAPAVTTAAA